MKYPHSNIFSLLFLLYMVLPAFAFPQPPDLKFRHLDVHNGLPSNTVTAFVKDPSGFLWIGTDVGLCRYDGNKFYLYRYSFDDSTSIQDNGINSLIVTRDKQLWVATEKGICRYNKTTNRFHRMYLPDSLKEQNGKSKRILLEDKEGYIWFLSHGRKLIAYNLSLNKFKTLDVSPDGKGAHIFSMFQSSGGQLWLSTNTYVIRYDPISGHIDRFMNPAFQSTIFGFVTAFAEAGDGTLWLSTWGNGLEHFDPVTNTSQIYLVEQLKELDGAKNVMSYPKWIHEAGSQKTLLWLVSQYGLLSFDTSAKKFAEYRPDIYDPYSNKVTYTISRFPGSFYDEEQDILWCYGPNGIDICDFNTQYVQTFRTVSEKNKMPILSMDGFVNDAYESDVYYMCTFITPSVFMYNEKLKTIKEIKLPIAKPGVEGIFQVDKNKFWLSVDDEVWEWQPTGNKLKKIDELVGKNKNELTKDCIILNYFRDSRGILWLAASHAGVCRYDGEKKEALWINKETPEEKGKISPAVVYDIAEARDGNIYVIDIEKGLFALSPSGKILERYFPDSFYSAVTRQKCLPAKFTSMICNHKDTIWICSDEGLLAFDIRSKKFYPYTEKDGAPSGVPLHVAEDKKGYLWLDCATSLIVFDPVKKRNKIFNYKNGYEGTPDGCTMLINDKGELRVAYNNLIEYIKGDPFNAVSTMLPGVLISDIWSGDVRVNLPDSSRDQHAVHVSYKNNQLIFEYSLPLYHDPESITYMYKLEGFDKDWIKAGTTHIAKYTNLPGGNLIFKVQAYDPNSNLYSAITEINVVVHPPFWRTWWFAILNILLVAALIYALYTYRLGQALKLERMRIAISSDLHDEVGATLSSISIYSNVAKRMAGTDTERSKEYLEKIEISSREMIDSMGDIVWSINPANDKPEKMLQRMRSYAYEILSAAGIELRWKEDEQLNAQKMTMEQRKNLYLFFKEAINNAAKYSKAQEVTVNMELEHNKLTLSIKDNGIGFDTAADHAGNGLKNMDLRSKLLKGKFYLSSSSSSGTALRLVIPV